MSQDRVDIHRMGVSRLRDGSESGAAQSNLHNIRISEVRRTRLSVCGGHDEACSVSDMIERQNTTRSHKDTSIPPGVIDMFFWVVDDIKHMGFHILELQGKVFERCTGLKLRVKGSDGDRKPISERGAMSPMSEHKPSQLLQSLSRRCQQRPLASRDNFAGRNHPGSIREVRALLLHNVYCGLNGSPALASSFNFRLTCAQSPT